MTNSKTNGYHGVSRQLDQTEDIRAPDIACLCPRFLLRDTTACVLLITVIGTDSRSTTSVFVSALKDAPEHIRDQVFERTKASVP